VAAGVKDGDKANWHWCDKLLQGVSFMSGQIQGKLLNKDCTIFYKEGKP
jgi:hypothetical protein